jgi:predicted metal-dependent hydrolase
MLPSRLIENLVLHELCHLIVHNQSKEFWKEVNRVVPDYRSKEVWLSANAANYNF